MFAINPVRVPTEDSLERKATNVYTMVVRVSPAEGLDEGHPLFLQQCHYLTGRGKEEVADNKCFSVIGNNLDKSLSSGPENPTNEPGLSMTCFCLCRPRAMNSAQFQINLRAMRSMKRDLFKRVNH